jgi:hypothetical protein
MQTHHLSLAASAVIVLAMTVLLAACGGGGGGTILLRHQPPPPAPQTPQTPQQCQRQALTRPPALQGLSIDLSNLPRYAPVLPAYYDAGVLADDNTPAGNRATDAAATLGRVLFYDRQLSVNNTISCASCHQQAQGFGDPRRFSLGFAGGATTAHAMRLGNVRYYAPGSMFWDKRAASLEAQATQPLQHPVEMGFDASAGGLPTLFAKLQALPYYPALFTAAFGDASRHRSPRAARAGAVPAGHGGDQQPLGCRVCGQLQPGAARRRAGRADCQLHRARRARPAAVHPGAGAGRPGLRRLPCAPDICAGCQFAQQRAGRGRDDASSNRRRSRACRAAAPSCTTGGSRRWSRWWSTTTAAYRTAPRWTTGCRPATHRAG